MSKRTECYTITIINHDERQTGLTLYITPAVVGKPHYGGWINSYGHYYRVDMAEPVFIEDGLIDELEDVTIKSLKKFEDSYFKPQYEIRAVKKRG